MKQKWHMNIKSILKLLQYIIGPKKICTHGSWSISEAPEFLIKVYPRFGLPATYGLPIGSCVFATAYIFIKTKTNTSRMMNHCNGVFFFLQDYLMIAKSIRDTYSVEKKVRHFYSYHDLPSVISPKCSKLKTFYL